MVTTGYEKKQIERSISPSSKVAKDILEQDADYYALQVELEERLVQLRGKKHGVRF